MRDLATRPSFALDEDGQTFLIGGTAVVPELSVDLLALLAYLNSEIARWYLGTITPSFKSSFQKYKPQHIEQLPIPEAVTATDIVRDDLARMCREMLDSVAAGDKSRENIVESQIDVLIATSVGFDLGEIRYR